MTSRCLGLHPRIPALRAAIDQGESVVLQVPKYFGGKHLMSRLYEEAKAADAERRVVLVMSSVSSSGSVDWQACWSSLRRSRGSKSRVRVTDALSFRLTAAKLLDKTPELQTVVMVEGASRSNVKAHESLVSALDMVLRESAPGSLQVIARDDYSVEFLRRRQLQSDYQRLSLFEISALPKTECKTFVRDAISAASEPGDVDSTADLVYRLTGGHPGLVDSALRHIKAGGDNATLESFLLNSDIFRRVARYISEDAASYLQVAEHFADRQILRHNSRAEEVLIELGILDIPSPGEGVICGELFGRLLKRLSASHSGIVSRATDSKSEDEIIVLFLSDLHFGSKHRFRFVWPDGHEVNPNEPSLLGLLTRDLQEIGLETGIDGVVIAGDCAESGATDEFRVARNFVRDLMEKLKLDCEKNLIVVCGNHDVTWQSDDAGQLEPFASRVEYEEYMDAIHKPRGVAQSIRLQSPSGTHELCIVGIDSNKVEGPAAAGVGFVSRESIEMGDSLIIGSPHSSSAHSTATWLVVHHHVLPVTSALVEDARGRKVSVLANASKVLSAARRWGATAILHGHQHQPFVSIAQSWPTTDGVFSGRLATIGAGSAGIKREELGPIGRNHYHILRLRGDRLTVMSRLIGDLGEAFTEHASLVVDLGSSVAHS